MRNFWGSVIVYIISYILYLITAAAIAQTLYKLTLLNIYYVLCIYKLLYCIAYFLQIVRFDLLLIKQVSPNFSPMTSFKKFWKDFYFKTIVSRNIIFQFILKNLLFFTFKKIKINGHYIAGTNKFGGLVK